MPAFSHSALGADVDGAGRRDYAHRAMTQTDRPAPGSHDRSTPSGALETSAANLFEAMLARA